MFENLARMFSLENRRILVTGASSGIGKATAKILSSAGARVVLSGRDEGRLQEVFSGLSGNGHLISPYDLTNLGGLNDWMKKIAADGMLSGLVHCAGISKTLPIQAISPMSFSNFLSVNTTSAFALMRAFRQKTVHSIRSSAVLIGSIMGMRGQGGLSAYGASKAAIIGLTKNLAVELAHENIRVNCISPGFVNTEMTQREWAKLSKEQMEKIESAHLLGVGNPEDVGYAIMFLLSDAAKWITGSNMVVDGGASSSF